MTNFRFAMKETLIYERPGLGCLVDPKAVKAGRVIPVTSDIGQGDYFIVDVDMVDHRPLAKSNAAR